MRVFARYLFSVAVIVTMVWIDALVGLASAQDDNRAVCLDIPEFEVVTDGLAWPPFDAATQQKLAFACRAALEKNPGDAALLRRLAAVTIETDYDAALGMLETAARNGDVRSQLIAGYMLLPRDREGPAEIAESEYQRAVEFLSKAADRGEHEALFFLAHNEFLFYLLCVDRVPRRCTPWQDMKRQEVCSRPEISEWSTCRNILVEKVQDSIRAAIDAGSIKAKGLVGAMFMGAHRQYHVVDIWLNGPKLTPKEILEMTLAGAEAGEATAIYVLKHFYQPNKYALSKPDTGYGPVEPDLDKYVYWLKRSAETSQLSRLQLSYLFLTGRDLETQQEFAEPDLDLVREYACESEEFFQGFMQLANRFLSVYDEPLLKQDFCDRKRL